ncbi:MAG: TldD/PmbA family protein [Bacteriovorax sp.]|nr:TldD/PmbA family protein [Bacteriovorax sp.]
MKNLIQKTIDRAMNSGADACDIIVNSSDSLNLSAQDAKLEKFKVAKTSVLGIRVVKNKKIGISYSESFDDDALTFAVKSSLENADYSDVNEFEDIKIKNSSDFVKENIEKDSSSMEEKIEFAMKLESEIRKRDSRITAVPYNGLSVAESHSYYMNSLGTYTEESESYLSGYTSALLKEGDITSMHYSSMQERSLAMMNLNQCIEETLEHAVSWLKAAPVATGKYDVVFDTNVLSEILGAFSSCFSAKEAIEKTNPWENKLQHQVADMNFTMIDSPLYVDAFFKQHVDSEGVLKKDLTLIENGVLKSFYHNTATAAYYGTTTTGHAARGAKSALGVSGSNWLIKAGISSKDEVTDGSYLEIIDVMGIGPGSDSVSGEFSFGASGYLCKNGKRIQPVKGITVAGNFNKLLNSIKCMGKDLEHNHSRGMFAPLIKFSELYVAGK